ncbi:MAG: enoyl-CoA hydratase/isomerase family protein [Rhizobiaceae bacterium]|nr:enoyl-CoA hydratase/isomerase family protein [Rhizobiaceae bacterium]
MTDLLQTASLELTREPGWLTIWLNRPETRNALSAEMAADLLAVLEAVAPDRSIRGVTLRGRGGTFCAGGDVKGFAAVLAGTADRDAVLMMSRAGGELFHRFNTMPQVTVALVEGAAMAGGLGLAAAADFCVAAGDARFALTETTLGIVPAQIAPFIVGRIGAAAARRIMLTAARIDAGEAAALGLVDRIVVDADGLAAAEGAIRAEVMRCAPGANAATKSLVLALAGVSGRAAIDVAAEAFADAMLSDEGREGIAAFVGKRKPGWAE